MASRQLTSPPGLPVLICKIRIRGPLLLEGQHLASAPSHSLLSFSEICLANMIMSLSPKKCYSSPQASWKEFWGDHWSGHLISVCCSLQEPKEVVSDLELRSFKVKNCVAERVHVGKEIRLERKCLPQSVHKQRHLCISYRLNAGRKSQPVSCLKGTSSKNTREDSTMRDSL